MFVIGVEYALVSFAVAKSSFEDVVNFPSVGKEKIVCYRPS